MAPFLKLRIESSMSLLFQWCMRSASKFLHCLVWHSYLGTRYPGQYPFLPTIVFRVQNTHCRHCPWATCIGSLLTLHHLFASPWFMIFLETLIPKIIPGTKTEHFVCYLTLPVSLLLILYQIRSNKFVRFGRKGNKLSKLCNLTPR